MTIGYLVTIVLMVILNIVSMVGAPYMFWSHGYHEKPEHAIAGFWLIVLNVASWICLFSLINHCMSTGQLQ